MNDTHPLLTQMEQDFESVWLSQKQLAELFGLDVATVNKHLAHALETAEINPGTDIRHREIQAANGKCYTVAHYGLNGIMALAYRGRGPLASQLRRWAGRALAGKGVVPPIRGGRFQFAPDEPAGAQSPMKELSFNGVTVRLDEEQQTVWLTQKQMAQLYGRDRSVIARHLQDAMNSGEIDRKHTCADLTQVQMEGEKQVVRQVEHYNLDGILSVGYRVNSAVGTHFRKWATEILRPVFLGTQPAPPQLDRERELWRAYHSAKTGAVQLSVLAALGVPILAAPAAARPAGADEAPAAERIFAALEACWAQLRPTDWLRRHEAPGEEPVWWLEPGQVAEELARCWPSARGWTRLALTRALARHPAWRRPQSSHGHQDPKQRFPGRPSPQRYVTLAVAALPPGLRERR